MKFLIRFLASVIIVLVFGCSDHKTVYLFDEPSKEDVEQWKTFCRENKRELKKQYCYAKLKGAFDEYEDEYEEIPRIDDIDLISHDINKYWRQDSLKRDAFVVWRLSEYMPIKQEPHSEKERFEIFEKQASFIVDSLYNKGRTSFDLAYASDFETCFKRVRYNLLNSRFKSRYPEYYSLLEQEKAIFDKYYKVSVISFNKVSGNEDVGSGWVSSMTENQYRSSLISDYNNAFEASYFALADEEPELSKRHQYISFERLAREYEAFASERENVKYRHYFDADAEVVEKEKKLLREDQQAFEQWILIREKISESLPENARDIFNNATNEIKRDKLILLKNRFSDFGITSNEVIEALLPYDCTDEQLFNYTSFTDVFWSKW